MRFPRARLALAAILGASAVSSCNDAPTIPQSRLHPASAASTTTPAAPKIVISQVYGGGGNSGATYQSDYVELFNAGTATGSLSGWSIQYASATGTGNFGASASQLAALSGSIAPGQYFLVQLASGGTAGAVLQTADLSTTATRGINMAGGAGKVALVDQTTSLGCNGSSTPCTATQLPHIIDLVGYGTGTSGANFFEGTGAAPTISSTLADFRGGAGCTDTDNNAADFTAKLPAPRTTATTAAPCSAPPPPPTVGPLDHIVISGGASVNMGSSITLTATLKDASDQTITDGSATYSWTSSDASIAQVANAAVNPATVNGLQAGTATITVSATSNSVTQTQTLSLTVAQVDLAHITLSAGTSPLVIGYQTQIFIASGSTNHTGQAANASNVTWSSSAPAIITIDSRGIVSAAGDGSAVLTATAADGSSGSYTLSTEVPIYSSSARTGHNTEFGVPTDADPSNDVIIARKQYTISYNPQRGGPNWVSWDLSATHLGSRNRCNCYTADTALARLGYTQYMYNTLDYTNGGYDRGHMEPSADQTTTDGENATTFFLSNFLPQTHGLNAGPWEALENALRDSVKAGREAYVIAGGVFANGVGLGSLKGEGKIFIPNSTWKIVVMMPANTGLANVTSDHDINVFAVNMPNVDSPGTNDWTAYRTTVQSIQQLTGYDFLSSLPDAIQCKVEVRDCAPTAHITGAGVSGGNEGQTLSFDGTTSTDPDAGDVLSYMWSVNGGTVSIQPTMSYTFPNNGSYVVRLIVSDQAGRGDTTATTVSIANVAPTVSLDATTSVSLLSGQSVGVTGGFTDPGADAPWQYQLAWGAGSPATGTLAASGSTVSGTHQYLVAGSYTVSFTVTDKDGASGTRSLTVNVGRVPVAGLSAPDTINVNENGNGNVAIRLTSGTVDVSTIDLSTVRIGSVSADRARLEQGGQRLSLDFSRKALVQAGLVAHGTTELVVTATLTNGVQVESHVAVVIP